MKRLILLLIASLTFAWAQQPLKVLSSNGVAELMKDLQPQLEKSIGRKIAFEFGTSAAYKERIDKGEAVDIAMLTPAMIDDLIKQGKVTAASRFDIAKAGVGVGVREGTAKPKIASSAEFKASMLAAKSVTLTGTGQSRTTVDAAFAKLGIADAMKPKMMLVGPGGGPPTVAAGKAEIVLTLVSEILPVKGVQLVGPLPADLQKYTTFTTGVSAQSKNAAASQMLVDALKKADLAAVAKSTGWSAKSGRAPRPQWPSASKNRSASIAAMQPAPAAVMACR